MPKQQVSSPDLAVPNGHFSHATVTAPGRMVFISGMTARQADGTVAGVGDVTEQAGGTLDDIARVDVYVRNMEDFEAIHAVRRQYFTGVAPASTLVEVSKFVNKDYLIEINAIAVLAN